jgi:hypothetical protein
MNKGFWLGVLVGVGGTYVYHRMMGLPGKTAK